MKPHFMLMALFWAASASAADSWGEPITGMEFVELPKGCFKMGVAANAFENADRLFRERAQAEKPEHEVCLDGFWIGRHEVRQSDWQKIMGEKGSSSDADAPTASMTWARALEFVEKLNRMSDGTAHFRLPTEAEWEYACKAGQNAADAYGGDALKDRAWYSSHYDFQNTGMRHLQPQPVGRKLPNASGLYDMLGNVWEWVQDGYRADAYAQHVLYNPVDATETGKHVIRGGGLRTEVRMMRCEMRGWLGAEESSATVGLRVVRDR